MSNLPKLSKLLQNQSFESVRPCMQDLFTYAENVARIENVIAVVSDLKNGTSRIFPGKLGAIFGISGYEKENSIWEKAILNLMTADEREEKYLSELRFFNFLRHIPVRLRSDYYMVSKLSMKTAADERINLIHRMYYIHATDSDVVTHALCLYGRIQPFDFVGKSVIVNSITGIHEEITSARDASILSKREQQVLRLIDSGKTSAEIAAVLSISKNTVSRHRQDILARLQVKNSVEACRIAKSMNII